MAYSPIVPMPHQASSSYVYDPKKFSFFASLSNELVLHILRFMPLADLMKFSELDNRIRNIVCNEDAIWRRLIPHLAANSPPGSMEMFIAAKIVPKFSPFLRVIVLSTTINISDACWIHEEASDPNLIERVKANGLIQTRYTYSKKEVEDKNATLLQKQIIILSQEQISKMQQANVTLYSVINEKGLIALRIGLLTVE